jgi:hypothetical protein
LASEPLKDVCPAVAWYMKRVLTPWFGAFPMYGILLSYYIHDGFVGNV